jgi:hypothetical protein
MIESSSTEFSALSSTDSSFYNTPQSSAHPEPAPAIQPPPPLPEKTANLLTAVNTWVRANMAEIQATPVEEQASAYENLFYKQMSLWDIVFGQ